MPKSSQDILRDLCDRAKRISQRDDQELDAVRHRAEMLFRKMAPNDPHYVENLKKIRFYPNVSPSTARDDARRWQNGCAELSSLLGTLADQLEIFGDDTVRELPTIRIRGTHKICADLNAKVLHA